MQQPNSADVKINSDGFIEITVSGDVTGSYVRNTGVKVKELLDSRDSKSKPALLLIDLRRVGEEDSSARIAAKDFLLMPFDKCAIYGASSKLSRTVSYLIKSVGLFKRVSYFSTRRKAVAWLKGESTKKPVRHLRSITYVPALIAFVLALLWYVIFSPFLSRLPSNYSLNAQVSSYDNLWDTASGKFSGELKSETRFTYSTLESDTYTSKIQAAFEVRKTTGEQIFQAQRVYGVNRLTLAHVENKADKKREGYLFAPRHLSKQPFTYWHVNYDAPVSMKFDAEDTLFGVKTYRYTGTLQADQTNELKDLLKLKTDEGINVDAQIQLWVDPVSGTMVKYSDQATAYYYNKHSGERLHPWNKFRNELTDGSVRQLAHKVQEDHLRINLYENVVPISLVVLAVLLFVFFSLGFSRAVGLTYAAAGLVLLVGIFTSFQVWYFINNSSRTQAQIKFDQEANSAREHINTELDNVVNVLRAGAGLFKGSNEVTKAEWKQFTDELKLSENFSGVQGVGYAAYVKNENKAAFSQQMQQQEPEFVIRPTGDKTAYVPVTYLEPATQRNQLAIGYDMYSETVRREAIDLATLSGNPAMSGKVTLVQEVDTDIQPGFLIYVPIYYDSATTTTQQRQANIAGFAYAPFRARNFISNAVSLNDPALNIEVFDTSDSTKADERNRLYGVASGIENDLITQEAVVTNSGRTWYIKLSASARSFQDVSQRIYGYIILVGGCLLSISLSYVLYLLLMSRRQAVDLAGRITEDLSAERNLALSNQQKDEAMLSSIGEGLIVISPSGIIERANPSALEVLGCKPKDLIGKKIYDVIPAYTDGGEVIEHSSRPSAVALTEGKPVSTTLVYKRKRGGKVPVSVNVAPVFLDDRMIGAIEVFHDLTKERQLDRAKTEFVSLASHQLRTPLTAIGWYTEMLLAEEDGKMNKEQRSYLAEIEDGNQRMVDLVNSLLDVSRIETDNFKVAPEPVDIISIAKQAVKDVEPDIFKRKQELVEEYEETIPTLKLDPRLTRIIFDNLLSNASKYTPDKGRIELKTYLSSNKLRIEVSDNGYGIPKKQQPLIFKKLFRADNVYTLDTGGTGLGLYIVKSIVEQTGGKIWFKSIENKGTTFFIELPLSGMKPKKGSKRLGE